MRLKRKPIGRWCARGAGVVGAAVVAVGAGSMTAAASAAAPKTINVGMIMPLTGSLAVFGQSQEHGATVAVKQINSTHYLGKTKLKLNVVDNKGDTATSVSDFQTYNSSSNITSILCCTTSAEAEALKPLVVKGTLPTIMTSAAEPGLPQLPNFVRVSYDATKPGGLFSQSIDAAAKHWHPKTAVLEVSTDSALDAAPSVLATWKNELAKDHIKLLGEVDSLTTDTNFSGPASTTVNQEPDMVVLDVQANAAPLLARALQQAGYRGHLLGNYSMSTPPLYQQAGSAFNGMTFAAEFSPLFNSPAAKTFVGLWNKEYGTSIPPDAFATDAYMAITFLAQAIKKAGDSANRKKVAAAMAKIGSFDSPEGKIKMAKGDASLLGSARYLQWQGNGSLKLVWTK